MLLVIALGKESPVEKPEIKHSCKLPVSRTKCKRSDGMRGNDARSETGLWHCAGLELLCGLLQLCWGRVCGHSFELKTLLLAMLDPSVISNPDLMIPSGWYKSGITSDKQRDKRPKWLLTPVEMVWTFVSCGYFTLPVTTYLAITTATQEKAAFISQMRHLLE